MANAQHADARKKLSSKTAQEIIGESVIRQAIDATQEGVTICDARHPEMPLIYVNRGFTRMTGYPAEEVLGINCRFLQGDDTLQPEIETIRQALRKGGGCHVVLRNYRRDGKLFYNELSLSAVRDSEGQLTHYIGIQKDVTRQVLAEQKLEDRDRELRRLNAKLGRLMRCDALTGLLNRQAFEECIERQWRLSMREQGVLSLFMIDVDRLKSLNGRYGHASGNACLRRVGEALEDCFGRASDYVARFGGDEFVVLNTGLPAGEAVERGQFLLRTVRTMKLPEPVDRLTVSIGLAICRPLPDTGVGTLIRQADDALKKAKKAGCDRLEQIAIV